MIIVRNLQDRQTGDAVAEVDVLLPKTQIANAGRNPIGKTRNCVPIAGAVAFDDGMTAQFEMSGRYQQWLPQVVLLDPAGTVVLKESRGRRFWMLFGSLFLAAWGIGVLALHSNSWLGWVGALLFCVAAFFIVMQLVRPDSLTLAGDAFTYTITEFPATWTRVYQGGLLGTGRR
jgi:hypothetical protein